MPRSIAPIVVAVLALSGCMRVVKTVAYAPSAYLPVASAPPTVVVGLSMPVEVVSMPVPPPPPLPGPFTSDQPADVLSSLGFDVLGHTRQEIAGPATMDTAQGMRGPTSVVLMRLENVDASAASDMAQRFAAEHAGLVVVNGNVLDWILTLPNDPPTNREIAMRIAAVVH